MNRDDDAPLIEAEHVIDALLVGVVAFAGVIIADVLPPLLVGQAAYLTPGEILARVPTGAVAFLLAFAFMWARARGLDVLAVYRQWKDS